MAVRAAPGLCRNKAHGLIAALHVKRAQALMILFHIRKDFDPADRLIQDITLALMATQTTEGAGHFPYDSDGSRKRKKPRQRFVDEVWPGVKPG